MTGDVRNIRNGTSGDEFLAMRLLRDTIPGQSERYLVVTPVKLR